MVVRLLQEKRESRVQVFQLENVKYFILRMLRLNFPTFKVIQDK